MAFIGNDIISLNNKENLASFSSTRYLEKVFCDIELSEFFRHPDMEYLPYLMWTCKETAYKIAVKSGCRKSFCPSNFQVTLTIDKQRKASCHIVFGKVVYGKKVVFTKSYLNNFYIHTIGSDTGISSLKFYSDVQQTKSNAVGTQSVHTRELFIQHLSKTLAIDKDRISVSSNKFTGIPKVLLNNKPIKVDLSLSHDGYFVSYSYMLPNKPGIHK